MRGLDSVVSLEIPGIPTGAVLLLNKSVKRKIRYHVVAGRRRLTRDSRNRRLTRDSRFRLFFRKNRLVHSFFAPGKPREAVRTWGNLKNTSFFLDFPGIFPGFFLGLKNQMFTIFLQ